MNKFYILLVLLNLCSSCIKSQNNHVGGSCEGCEAVYEYGNKVLKSVDTIPGYFTESQKVKLSGIVYHLDGKTPAKDVLLYAYQTNDKGKYPKKASSKGWEQRHGYLRGWIITDSQGRYTFYTSRPASYPKTKIPQHIHVTVKEPNKNEYYIEDFYFSDDPNLSIDIKNKAKPRGGYGVVTLKDGGAIKYAHRDIILGLNIPDYE